MHFEIIVPVEFKAACPTCLNLTGGPFENQTYSFLQLHFHWGSDNMHGSEHEITGNQYVRAIPKYVIGRWR